MVARNSLSDKATPTITGASAPTVSRGTGTLAILRLLSFGFLVVAPVLGGVACYVSYQYSYDAEIETAAAVATVASGDTARMLDKYLLVAARISDLLEPLNSEQIHLYEKVLHGALGQQIAAMPEVAAAWVIDATGREVVSARVYPVNGALDESDRKDFRALRDTSAQTFIWMLRAHGLNSATIERYVTVSARRPSPDGRFNGIVIVAVVGSYFTSSYKSLIRSPDDTIDLVERDGTILAQFPDTGLSEQPPLPNPLLAKAIAAGGESGIADRGTPFDNAGRIVAVSPVANYPVYVAVERSKVSIAGKWLRSISGAAVIGVAAIVALIALTRLALHRTRREAHALARAAEAFADRAALEFRLHQSQRLEAIAWLATGMACEFDRLLQNSGTNIERLDASIKDIDSGQKNFVAALQQNCAQASVLIKRLVGFARREPIKPRPININEVIAQTLEHARQFPDAIVREFQAQEDLWPSCVDPDQLMTTILNLMFNARDVSAETDGQIILTMNTRIDRSDVTEPRGPQPGEYVGLFIENNRRGNARETGAAIPGQPPTTPELGKDGWPSLSLVHELAQSAGGYWTVSREPAHETTIRIYFPRYVGDLHKAEHDPIRYESATNAPD